MTYLIDQEKYLKVANGARARIFSDDVTLDEQLEETILRLAQDDCMNYWNSRDVAFTHDGDSVAVYGGMPETSKALLRAIAERDGRGYPSALELYVHAWECVQSDFVELKDEDEE